MSKQLALAAVLAFAVTGCAQKTVNDVMADPSRYADRNITLKSEVVESYSVAGHGFYRLEDTTGRLWILSTKGVPRTGAYVQVKGKIKEDYKDYLTRARSHDTLTRCWKRPSPFSRLSASFGGTWC